MTLAAALAVRHCCQCFHAIDEGHLCDTCKARTTRRPPEKENR